ncbi:hypothetical protein FJT64_006865 [Amphibalanus amphitrite]|uniref:Uncharacterized protein n=1 Tax=Amphibalanus amphitrite TaxID=1232801 RepID=A0A6A4VNC7_AMPAM|nr:uncharacterized protein LOC122364499 [Amphibalanus amphitrite]KAF0295645.1 hypothetical protein FJT64_006865 [Amphibalanus amphitrite]
MWSRALSALTLVLLTLAISCLLGTTDARLEPTGRVLVQHRTETITELTSTVTTKLYTCITGFATSPPACSGRRRRRRSQPKGHGAPEHLPSTAARSVTALESSLSHTPVKKGRFLYTYMKRVTTTVVTTDTSYISSATVMIALECTVAGANLINMPNCP